MIQLPHGCSCSELKVNPTTWKRVNTSIKENWYIHYRFYDPAFKERFPKGFQKIIKGMNAFKTISERQDATRNLLENELILLKERAYNPITGTSEEPITVTYEIDPDMPMVPAMEAAAERLDLGYSRKTNMRSVLKYFNQAAIQLRMDQMPIKDVRRRYIKMILDQIGKNKGDKWTNSCFNWYRGDLRMVFAELLELEAVDVNPIIDISKREETQKIKELLTDEQRIDLDTALRRDNYLMWRFMHIFCNSGARSTEMVNVKKEHVDLKRQVIKCTVKKGKTREVERPIKDDVLYLWQEVMAEALPGQNLFSRGLKPWRRAVLPEYYSKKWKNEVMEVYGITATWYSLKHLNTGEMAAIYGTELPAHLNQHSEAVLVKHYAPRHKSREDAIKNELIKKSANTFVPLLKKPA